MKAVEHYALTQERNQEREILKYKDKEIKEEDLVLCYDNKLNNDFKTRFETTWEDPFHVQKKYLNGSY